MINPYNAAKPVTTILVGSLLSLLMFLSISFITVLTHISPWHHYKSAEAYTFDIGFPFKYYRQFWMSGSTVPNSGWSISNLFYDCLLTWAVVAAIYLLVKRTRNNNS
jgi:hypothetical protein